MPDRAPPELRERRRLHAEAFHPLRVRRHLDRRDRAVGDEADGRRLRGVERDAARGGVEVPRRDVPLLPLPPVVVQPDDLAVGAAELRVDVDEPLHPVVAGGQVGEVPDGGAEVGAVDGGRRAGEEAHDVAPEHRRAHAADLEARLDAVAAREDHVHAARGRLAPHARRHDHLEAGPRAPARPPVRDRRRLRGGGGRDEHAREPREPRRHPRERGGPGPTSGFPLPRD
jgi:hypothetical protein